MCIRRCQAALAVFLTVAGFAGNPQTLFAQPSKAPDSLFGVPAEIVEAGGQRTWLHERPDLVAVQPAQRGPISVMARTEWAQRPTQAAPGGRTHAVYRVQPGGGEVVILDEIAARLAPTRASGELDAWAAQHGLAVEQWVTADTAHLRLIDPSTQTAFEAADALARSGLAAWAEPIHWAVAERQSGDTPPIFQWHLDNQGFGGGTLDSDIDAVEAWEITVGSPEVVFALLDDGVDLDHPDFAGRIFLNFADPPNGVDDDGNGLVDDFTGWDFADGDADPRPSAFLSPFNFVSHNDIHGTPMAGLVAAFGSSETVMTLRSSGVVQQGQIMPIRVSAAGQFVSSAQHAAAIRYAADMGADVIVLGYTLPMPSREVEEALQHAMSTGRGGLGTPVFAPAGEIFADPVGWPARTPWALAVGGVTNRDGLPPDVSFGGRLNFVAPTRGGTAGIFTTDVSIPDRGWDEFGTLYTLSFGGSSAATAIAAGVAGLVIAVSPEATQAEIATVLQATADQDLDSPIGQDPFGFSAAFGWGRVNAHDAVVRALASDELLDDPIEPNDAVTVEAAPSIGFPFQRDLILRDVDAFEFTFPTGRWLTIEINHLPTDPPPTVELRLFDGSLLGNGVPQADGSIQINSFNLTGVAFNAVLGITPNLPDGAHMGYNVEIRLRAEDNFEGNDFPADAAPVTALDSPITAHLDPAADIDIYAISGSEGDDVVIETFARRLAIPSPADTVLTLLREDGETVVAMNDDFDRADSRIEATLPANELYFIVVQDFHAAGGENFAYELAFSGFTTSAFNSSQVLRALLGTLPLHPGMDVNADGRTDVADLIPLLD